jgi:protein O-GlcNAc transferase
MPTATWVRYYLPANFSRCFFFSRLKHSNAHTITRHVDAGNVYKEAGLLREAQSTYLTALQLQPDHAVVLGNLAAVQLEMGDLDIALTTFQRALHIQPDFPDCLSNMGNALKLAGRLQEAVAVYHQCLNLTDWKHTDGLNNAANAYKDLGDSVTAERMYRQAIVLRPTFAGARSNLGNLLKEQFKLEEALREYEAAIAADNNFADAWSNMGNCLKDLNRMDDAIRAYETVWSPLVSDRLAMSLN